MRNYREPPKIGFNGLLVITSLIVAILIYKRIEQYRIFQGHPLKSMFLVFLLWTVIGMLFALVLNRIFGDEE